MFSLNKNQTTFNQNNQIHHQPPPPIEFQPKKTPITDDYEISNNVLGLGINGKVVECVRKSTGKKFALKVFIIKKL